MLTKNITIYDCIMCGEKIKDDEKFYCDGDISVHIKCQDKRENIR